MLSGRIYAGCPAAISAKETSAGCRPSIDISLGKLSHAGTSLGISSSSKQPRVNDLYLRCITTAKSHVLS